MKGLKIRLTLKRMKLQKILKGFRTMTVIFCGTSRGRYHKNKFLFSCDACKGWFHGRCVKVTQEQMKHLEAMYL
jgi:hypothetical protein